MGSANSDNRRGLATFLPRNPGHVRKGGAVVSLDGVMVPMRPGEDVRADACRRKASCGTVSFLDKEGTRIGCVCPARMQEPCMTGLKARPMTEEAARILVCGRA